MKHHSTRWRRVLGIVLSAVSLAGCQKSPQPPAARPTFGLYLPWTGQAFDIMVEDLDGNRQADLTVIDHGGNHAQIFYQDPLRQFRVGPVFNGVGFHPGNLFRWPGDPARFIMSAEGDNAVRVLLPDPVAGFRIESQLDELQPRYGSRFRWAGWGESLALSPFDTDSLFLLKDYDPVRGKAAARIHIPLAEHSPSVLWPGPLTVTDIDGDGSDDLLYTTRVTRELFVVQAPTPEPEVTGKKKKKQKPPVIKPRLLATDPRWGGPSQVIDGDLNGDGAVDLLVPDETVPGRINVLINEGKGRFKPAPSIPAPNDRGVTAIRSAIDKDGLHYILAAGYGVLSLYQVPSNWVPEQPLTPLSVHWHSDNTATALAFKDIDGDGWLDLVLGRQQGEQTLWIQYGPLWDSFKIMSEQGFNLDDGPHEEK
jgi:hypothetical protein